VREETIFVALPEEIRRPTYLRVSRITLDNVFDDIISTKTRNNVRGIKTADTLLRLITVI